MALTLQAAALFSPRLLDTGLQPATAEGTGRQHRQIRIPPRLADAPLLAQYSPLGRKRIQLPGGNHSIGFSWGPRLLTSDLLKRNNIPHKSTTRTDET